MASHQQGVLKALQLLAAFLQTLSGPVHLFLFDTSEGLALRNVLERKSLQKF